MTDAARWQFKNQEHFRQTIADSGAQVVLPGVQDLYLNHTTKITATIADSLKHQELLVKQIDAGTAGHTVTLTSGTWDGSNTIITLNADNEAIKVSFDDNGDGTILENVGGVALS